MSQPIAAARCFTQPIPANLRLCPFTRAHDRRSRCPIRANARGRARALTHAKFRKVHVAHKPLQVADRCRVSAHGLAAAPPSLPPFPSPSPLVHGFSPLLLPPLLSFHPLPAPPAQSASQSNGFSPLHPSPCHGLCLGLLCVREGCEVPRPSSGTWWEAEGTKRRLGALLHGRRVEWAACLTLPRWARPSRRRSRARPKTGERRRRYRPVQGNAETNRERRIRAPRFRAR